MVKPWNVWWLFIWIATSEPAPCLPDAVKAEERRWLKDNAGRDLPLGLLTCDWASSMLFTSLTDILIQEVLGYHAFISPASLCGSTPHQLYASFGCTEFNHEEARDCENETRIHVTMDSWITGYPTELDTMKSKYPHLAPSDLGSMGYDGHESVFLQMRSRAAAAQQGLALAYYESYNTSHHDPKEYFCSISDIGASLKQCNQTDLFKTEFMENYLNWTGDNEGVTFDETNSYVARCYNGSWWLAPSCRWDPLTCIPMITAGTGWRVQALMQWSTAYGIPSAIGVGLENSDWVSIVQDLSVMFYWWLPDATFAHLQPSKVIFPDFNAREWAQGNQKTMMNKAYIGKTVSSNLRVKAPIVEQFVSQINFDMEETQAMLLAARSTNYSEVACEWVRANRPRWHAWRPDASNCLAGFGVVDTAQRFLTERRNATSCEVCQPGSFSEAFFDEKGATYRCVPCAAGSHQTRSAASACDLCPAGTYTKSAGEEKCTSCEVGRYQSGEGKTICMECSDRRTTLFQAGASLEACVCQKDFIEQNGTCNSCGLGLQCPKGSTVELLLGTANVTEGQDAPSLQSGFQSDPHGVPYKTFRCREFCPGGTPGVCSAGRMGPTCSECPVGTFASYSGPCLQCPEESIWGLWLTLLLLPILPVTAISYYVVAQPYIPRSSPTYVVSSILGEAINQLQELLVVSAVPSAWPPVVMETAAVFEILSLNLEVVGLGCFVTGGTVRRFLAHTMIFPAVLLLVVVLSVLSRFFKEKTCFSQRLRWTWFGTLALMGTFCQTTFPTMANVGLSPLMCYAHPSGEESVLKYSNIFCWTESHAVMLAMGFSLLLIALAFLVLCLWAAWSAPGWSPQAQAAAKFLFADFRPEHWWYGTLLLFRELLLSMPSVLVPSSPALQLALLQAWLLLFLVLQSYVRPKKLPVVNLISAVTNCIFVMLLAVGLGGIQGSDQDQVLETAGAIICILLFTIFSIILILFAFVALLWQLNVSSTAEHWSNLGPVPRAKTMYFLLRNLARSMEVAKVHKEFLLERMEELGTYDARMVLTSLLILQCEIGIDSLGTAGSAAAAPRYAASGSSLGIRGSQASMASAISAASVKTDTSGLGHRGRIATPSAVALRAGLGSRARMSRIASALQRSNQTLFDQDDSSDSADGSGSDGRSPPGGSPRGGSPRVSSGRFEDGSDTNSNERKASSVVQIRIAV
ncbi:unnamed protein product [Durusdinium trenchii]|uniref:Tyrosine-protein kinase ephrin type A/B receptor-like domain-containing protein n=2 Tax=Durusdinium trenchii TaxID=1381693 RepID=A0ABP0I5Y0_9DINO